MKIEPYVEIVEFDGDGYQPCIDFGEWRVAKLRYTTDVKAENITYLERHNQTDEVFVLLEGRCMLIIGEGRDTIAAIQTVEMSPKKIYNVKKGTYHNHSLSPDADVLIVENRDTGSINSDRIPLTENQRRLIVNKIRAQRNVQE